MSSKHLDYYIYLVVILLLYRNVKCSEEAASISRSLNLSIPAWRPLVQNPYHHHHQFFQQNTASTPGHLISYSHLEGTNKNEIIEAAKYNAQTLRKINELSQQPITSYSNPYPLYTQTPGPLTKAVSTTAFINPNILRQQPLVAASNLMHARLPYPGKSASLYSTKLNFLGKPDMSHHHHHIALHQNGIHQTIATTPKIAGFTKEHSGRVNFHYHHPSFGMTPIFDSTTKRIPMFGSSVTPHSTTKVHPVMSKLQAHMALAAMSQNQQSNGNNNNKLKHAHRANSGSSQEFSPPSQIVSNYANYDTATRIPLWNHNGYPTNSHNQAHHSHNVDFHHHVHKPESQVYQQQQQQILPSVHPSIITPFLEQVQIKQKEAAAAAEQKNSFKQSHESSSLEHNGSFEVVNDVFSKHLVPPPPSTSKTHHHHYHQKPSKAVDKVEKYPKLNLSMQSPLQDASRFNYNNVISTATPSSSSTSTASPYRNNHDVPKYRPSNSENVHFETEKPNVFLNLNRPKENPYKQHKLLHPAYTGGIKRPGSNQDKPFLPTPYKPEKEEEIKIDFEPQHNYFTIEDAVTPNFGDILKYDHHEGSDELEIITLRPQVKPTRDYFTQTTTSTTVAPLQIISSTVSYVEPTAVELPAPSSSPKPRQKLRRRKPKPQNQQVLKEQQANEEHQQESTSEKPLRTRGNIKSNNSTPAPEIELRTRNRLNHPNRVRTKPNFTTTPAAALSSSNDYDYTAKPFDEDLRRSEIATTQTTSEGTSIKSIESSEIPDVIRHRVRLRYKSKLNSKPTTSHEGIDFKHKLKDSQISDSENESVVVKQPSIEATTEFNVVTENPFVETKSSLKLPNLKLRNEVFTTIPTTPETVSISASSTKAAENEDNNNISQKIANRPRFSIKELKRKQFLTSSSVSSASTTSLTSSPSSTTSRPDNQRFNRYRVNLNRRRNETNDSSSSEEIDTTRRRYSSTRYSSSQISTTSSTTPVDSTTKRTSLPKRIYTPRNFTRPTASGNIEAETTSQKPSIRNSTFVSNRPSTPSLRQRIQNYNYKKKDTSNEVTSDQDDTIKNLNFETIITHEEPSSTTTLQTTTSTSTELPSPRETSIMKIAKTPSSILINQPIKSTTINSNTVIENTLSSSLTPGEHYQDSTDLVGSPSEHSQRVAELTISANENSQFKSANIGLLSRRIPNYFTISTDDPILPIQAFFPQIKTNESN
ncbi:hypothetical protein ACKWTF_009732 [Chironomus riparius]